MAPTRVGVAFSSKKDLGLAGVPHAPARLLHASYAPSAGGQSSDRGVPAHLAATAECRHHGRNSTTSYLKV